MLTCALVGGFLGAGKTTAVLALAERFAAAGQRVAIVTNDQGSDLVDTRLAAMARLPVAEIGGGCFCCRFDSLAEAVAHLAREHAPAVVLAEPVGSCTDLRATVLYPLARLHEGRTSVAPLSVLVDPLRAAAALGIGAARRFSPDVQYVYEKQLEEADLIVVNKCDVLPATEREPLLEALRTRFPRSEVLVASARTGEHLDRWMDRLSGALVWREQVTLDYDRYAAGEARLGWLNGRWSLRSKAPFDGDDLLMAVGTRAQATARRERIEIAHLKMSLDTPGEAALAVVQLVDGARPPAATSRLPARLTAGDLVVNLRAEGDPPALAGLLIDALGREIDALGIDVVHERVDYFKPARPEPTYRITKRLEIGD